MFYVCFCVVCTCLVIICVEGSGSLDINGEGGRVGLRKDESVIYKSQGT